MAFRPNFPHDFHARVVDSPTEESSDRAVSTEGQHRRERRSFPHPGHLAANQAAQVSWRPPKMLIACQAALATREHRNICHGLPRNVSWQDGARRKPNRGIGPVSTRE